jgi:hypothetical protein
MAQTETSNLNLAQQQAAEVAKPQGIQLAQAGYSTAPSASLRNQTSSQILG